MNLAEGRGNADSDAQETSHLHWSAEDAAEEFATGILKHQNVLTAILHKFKRSHRPRAVQLIIEGVFVDKAFEDGRCRLLRGGEYDQYVLTSAASALAPPSTEDEPTVLRQNLEATRSVRVEPRRLLHSLASPLSRSPGPPGRANVSIVARTRTQPHFRASYVGMTGLFQRLDGNACEDL